MDGFYGRLMLIMGSFPVFGPTFKGFSHKLSFFDRAVFFGVIVGSLSPSIFNSEIRYLQKTLNDSQS